MSHPDFANEGNPLGQFIEECAEALQAAGKCARFGYDFHNPLIPESQRETNREWLLRELKDVDNAIRRLRKELNE